MANNEGIERAALDLVRTLTPPASFDRARRVDRAIDSAGRPVLDGRDFLPLRSPDGSVWRLRISNTGVLTAKKEVAT